MESPSNVTTKAKKREKNKIPKNKGTRKNKAKIEFMNLIPNKEARKGFSNSLVESPIKVLSIVFVTKLEMAMKAL
jgi:hypothetical protein